MSELTPCPSCQRHIRVTSSACPFCNAATLPADLTQTRATRRTPIQKGVKRAVLFAIGAGLTSAACADGEDDEADTTEMMQAIYGAPVTTDDDSTSADTTSAVNPDESDDSDTTELAQPVYGAPIDTDTTENTSTEGDTTDDSGPIFQPVYGAPVPWDAGADETGAVDAGVDAASPDASLDDDSDTTELAQPVYGAPIDTTDEAASTKTDVGPTWNDGDGGGLIQPLYGAFPADVE